MFQQEREGMRIGYVMLICLRVKRTRGKKENEFIIGPIRYEVFV